MLEDYYIVLEVYREVSTIDDWGNTDDAGNWQLNGIVQGFMQTRSGSMPHVNQAIIPDTDYILYTDTGVDIKNNDRVKYSNDYYKVEYIQPNFGISGMEDHQEIGLSVSNNLGHISPPKPPVTMDPVTLTDGFNPMGAANGVFFRTIDEGLNWSTETIEDTNYDVSSIVINNSFGLLLADNNTNNTSKLYETYDGITFEESTESVPNNIVKIEDFIYKSNGQIVSRSEDNIVWETINGIAGTLYSGSVYGDGNYYVYADNTIYKSLDGLSYTQMSNQPSNVFSFTGSNSILLSAFVSNNNKIMYEYSPNGADWLTGGDSTISASSLMMTNTFYFKGFFHTISIESDFSKAYYEFSSDCRSWIDVSNRLPAGYLGIAINSDGNNLYMSLADSSFNGYVMVSSDGISWSTPVAYDIDGVVSMCITGVS